MVSHVPSHANACEEIESAMNERPLITFLLIAFNQEKFIEEAVRGAFSQTYAPLEIILSDDVSSDRTFEIMQKMAAAYQGPHSIILNRNEKTLGVGAHINRCMELSHGELVVGAAGDDISLPERSEEIYNAWLDSDKTAFSLDSRYEMIDEAGKRINVSPDKCLPKEQQLHHFSKTITNYVSGCTHAWHRKVFDVFGPLPNITLEDVAIPPRSMLLGKVVCINKSLVRYRIHEGNISSPSKKHTSSERFDRYVWETGDLIIICDDVIRCINEYKGIMNDSSNIIELGKYVSCISAERKRLELRLKILTGYPIVKLFFLFKYMYRYSLRRPDMVIVVIAISKTAWQLSRIMRYSFLDGLKKKLP